MFKPINDNVVIKPIDAQDVTHGGVIIPDTSQEATMQAEVIAHGPGAVLLDGKRHNMMVTVGDKVVYAKFGAKKLDFEGEEYMICKEADLLTIIKE
tara:strand:- start:217 stop:504 length:288 start_codon:yes stop_codon:yes gene_type:complete